MSRSSCTWEFIRPSSTTNPNLGEAIPVPVIYQCKKAGTPRCLALVGSKLFCPMGTRHTHLNGTTERCHHEQHCIGSVYIMIQDLLTYHTILMYHHHISNYLRFYLHHSSEQLHLKLVHSKRMFISIIVYHS